MSDKPARGQPPRGLYPRTTEQWALLLDALSEAGTPSELHAMIVEWGGAELVPKEHSNFSRWFRSPDCPATRTHRDAADGLKRLQAHISQALSGGGPRTSSELTAAETAVVAGSPEQTHASSPVWKYETSPDGARSPEARHLGAVARLRSEARDGSSSGPLRAASRRTDALEAAREVAAVEEPEDPMVLGVGDTTMVELQSPNPYVKIYAKCEFTNPTGSIKDRIAEHILSTAEEEGVLKRHSGQLVVCASSGNTGAAVARSCATRGYKCKVFTTTKCSSEKVNAVKAYGAECVVSTSGKPADHPGHYQNLAKAEVASTQGAFDVDQYNAPANANAYYETLGPEIWEQTREKVTHFVAAGSTGGTISGVGRYLKEKSEGAVQVVLADPHGSCFSDYFRGEQRGGSGVCTSIVEGVGNDSIPGVMDFRYVDRTIQISDAESIGVCHELAQKEGLCVGSSAGLNVAAARQMARTMDKPGVIVTVLPDHGMKYMSKVHNASWLRQLPFLHEEDFCDSECGVAPLLIREKGYLRTMGKKIRVTHGYVGILEDVVGEVDKSPAKPVDIANRDGKTERVIIEDCERTFARADHQLRLGHFLNGCVTEFGNYSQGMAHVAAMLMLTEENDTVMTILRALNKHYIPGHWAHEATGFAVNAYVFSHVCKSTHREVLSHLEAMSILPEIYCRKWFERLWVHALDFEQWYVFFEAFLECGFPYLVACGLSAMEVLKGRLLRCGPTQIHQVLSLLAFDNDDMDDLDGWAMLDGAKNYLDLVKKTLGSEKDLMKLREQLYEVHLRKRMEAAARMGENDDTDEEEEDEDEDE